jgi:UDP-N-acetylmuramoyl-tripeptide--D-alanyl-D-alanine ligase
MNALCAMAAAIAVGASLYDIKFGLEMLQAVKGRLQIQEGIQGLRIIDDSYNANPDAMCVAIDCLSELPGEKILVIGDMAELGETALQQHAEVGRYAKQKGIQTLLALGNLSQAAVSAFGEGATLFETHAQINKAILQNAHGQVILIKGSRAARMENVVNALINKEGR